MSSQDNLVRLRRRPAASLVALVLATCLPTSPAVAQQASAELSLTDAAHQALVANLELISRRRALEANREEIGVVRSVLLPQIDVGAEGSWNEESRNNDGRGNVTTESVTLAARFEQLLYDEEAWSDLSVQKSTYLGQEAQLASFEQGVVQEAATAFIELDRAGELLSVQVRNRELTAQNLETSRARIAAGYSSEREVLRWESQLASNDQAIVGARTQMDTQRFNLNRVRNHPAETSVDAVRSTIEDYGFVFARPELARAIKTAEGGLRLRDYLTRLGIARSPDIAVLDAAVAVAKREKLSADRAFWTPTLSLAAGVDHLAESSDDPSPDTTEWGVGGRIDFPLLEGGSKFYRSSQTRSSLHSLRFQRRATTQQVEQTVRAAFALAAGSFEIAELADRQQVTAQRNFELVDESYQLGVASILSLLDAQGLRLNAEEAFANAYFNFLRDLVAAERAISFYPFLEPRSRVQAILDDVERQVTPARSSTPASP